MNATALTGPDGETAVLLSWPDDFHVLLPIGHEILDDPPMLQALADDLRRRHDLWGDWSWTG